MNEWILAFFCDWHEIESLLKTTRGVIVSENSMRAFPEASSS